MSTFKYKFMRFDISSAKWDGISSTSQTCDANFIKGNNKWIGVIPQSLGGGLLTLVKQTEPGRVSSTHPQLQCHSQTTQDFEFMPYTSDYLATCSADAEIKFWKLPEKVTEIPSLQPLQTLKGNSKKVNLLAWNPSAQGILASSSIDKSIRVFDVLTGTQLTGLEVAAKDYCISLEWNTNGKLLGSSWKDKQLRIIDPRSNQIVLECQGHQGSKPLKFTWMGDLPQAFSCGFNEKFEREFKVWDIRNFGTTLQVQKIDNQSANIYPYYDSDLKIMYLSGKGEGMLRYLEFNQGQFFNHNNNFQSSNPGKSYSMIPKYALDVNNCEVGRFLKAGNDNVIQQISVVYPKRNTGFQEDIFPPTYQNYSIKATAWASGSDSEPTRLSLDPSKVRKSWELESDLKAQTSSVNTTIVQEPIQQPIKTQPVVQQVVQQPVQPVVQQPVQQIVEQPVQQVVEQPVQQVVQQPVQQVVEQPVQQVVQQPVQVQQAPQVQIQIVEKIPQDILDKVTAQGSQIITLQTQLIDAQGKSQVLQAELASSQTQLQASKDQVLKLQQQEQTQVQELNNEIQQRDAKIQALTQEIEQLRLHQTELESQITQLNTQIQDLNQQLAESHSQGSQSTDLQDQINSLVEQNNQLQQQVQDSQSQEAALQQQAQQLTEQNSQLQEDLNILQERLDNSTQAHTALEEQNQDLQLNLQSLEQQKNQLQEFSDQLQEQLQTLQQAQSQIQEHPTSHQEQPHEHIFEEEELGEFTTGNNVLIVFTHPNSNNSFTSAQRDSVIEGLENSGFNVVVSDLYKDDFDPRILEKDFFAREDETVLNISKEQKNAFQSKQLPSILKREIKRVVWSDYIIFISPIWWGSVTATMKGWFDRVLLNGWAYNEAENIYGKGGLKGKKAWLVTSCGGPEEIYNPFQIQGMKFQDLLHHVFWNTFHFCGLEVVRPYNIFGVDTKSQDDREDCLRDLRDTAENLRNVPILYGFTENEENFGLQLPSHEQVQDLSGLSLEHQQQIREEVENLKVIAREITGSEI